MPESRFDRQELLFGAEGQARMAAVSVALVGLGGLGSHVAQQLAYLGVRQLTLIDGDIVEASNLNRLVGAGPEDTDLRRLKVRVAERTILHIEPGARVSVLASSFISPEGFAALAEADWVIAGLDRHGARAVLAEVCAAYERPYIDVGTDIETQSGVFGGHVYVSRDDHGCLRCADLLDEEEVRWDLATDRQRQEEEHIYGVRRRALGQTGPSVVSLNGILASVAVTEFMRDVTGLGSARQHLEYKGHLGVLVVDRTPPKSECYVCSVVRGQRDRADLDQYLTGGLGNRL